MCLELWKSACGVLVTCTHCALGSQIATALAALRLALRLDQVGAGELLAHSPRGLSATNCHCATANLSTPPPAARPSQRTAVCQFTESAAHLVALDDNTTSPAASGLASLRHPEALSIRARVFLKPEFCFASTPVV